MPNNGKASQHISESGGNVTQTELDLIQFVRGIQPVSMLDVATDLVSLAKSGAEWPKASAQNWIRELEGLVSTEKLILENGLVRVPVVGARPKQMEMKLD